MERPKSGPKTFRQPKQFQRPPKQGHSSLGAEALPSDRVIYGIHAVEAALANPNRTVKKAYLTENAAAKLAPLVLARELTVTEARPHDLDALLNGDAVHQGAVLLITPLAQPSLDDFLDALPDGKPAALAMLDQVTDPHNAGAVLRSAAAFGVGALIVQDRHSPPLSGALAKAASGALEHVPVISTVNLARAIDRLKEHGFRCVGFDSNAGQRFDSEAAASPRTIYIFGAEDKGLRRLIREGCDALYALSASGAIRSLNVSNAAAIVFYEASKLHGYGLLASRL